MCTKKELVEWLEANVPDDYTIIAWGSHGDTDKLPLDLCDIDYEKKEATLNII